MAKIVNSWNEWDPLKRVVVGSAEGANYPALELGMHVKNDLGRYTYGSYGPWPQDEVAEAVEQQNEFARTFEKRGVTVDRVVVHKSMKSCEAVSTPDWTHPTQRNAANPRDLTLIMGNEIVEAPGTMRCRYYEYLYMRPLFEKYYREDPECMWVSAPRPRLTDDSYEPNYWWNLHNVWSHEEKVERFNNKKWALTEVEPLWDAADMIRAGKDIFLQPSSVNNQLGRDWLRRYITSRGLRLHEIRFDSTAVGHYAPWHIDSTLVFPKPGMVIYTPGKGVTTPEMVELFKKNDWEMVPAADPVFPWNNKLSLCGWGVPSNKPGWISLNVISIDPKTICVDANEVKYIEQLNSIGFEVEPVKYDKLFKFGGMLHCNTLDIYREGGCEDYFPNQ